MIIVREFAELFALNLNLLSATPSQVKKLGEPRGGVGLVPTMGALHRGHAGLIELAAQQNEKAVVSIFVNPTQFGPNEDFSRYPRSFDADVSLAASAGAQVVFAPSVEQMFPGPTSRIEIGQLAERWEGAHRPGHFSGVSTVVAKLLNLIRPDRAYFGWKDLQQCLVIQRLIRDLNFKTALTFAETYREPDGLAYSSRNVYLDDSERKVAPQLYQSLMDGKAALSVNSAVFPAKEAAVNALAQRGFSVDYWEVVQMDTLEPVKVAAPSCAIITAARLGRTRLIDNIRL